MRRAAERADAADAAVCRRFFDCRALHFFAFRHDAIFIFSGFCYQMILPSFFHMLPPRQRRRLLMPFARLLLSLTPPLSHFFIDFRCCADAFTRCFATSRHAFSSIADAGDMFILRLSMCGERRLRVSSR